MAKGISIAARKAKGRQLQQTVRDAVLALDPALVLNDDVRSTPMGSGGADLMLSTVAKKVFPYAVECKNSEKATVWAAYEQALAHAKLDPTLQPVAVMKRNHGPTLAIVSFEHFMALLTQLKAKKNDD